MTRDVEALIAAWTPDRSDYIEAFRARNKANHADEKIIALIGLCLLVATAGGVTGADALTVSGISAAVSAGVVALVCPALAVRRLWRRNTHLRANMRMVLHPEDGVTLEAGEIVTNFPWSTLGRCLETPRVFVVPLAGRGRRPAILLAKRALAQPDEESAARLLLQRAGATATSLS